jgi:lipid-A-disaccharide synthase-like uncharacterized protein
VILYNVNDSKSAVNGNNNNSEHVNGVSFQALTVEVSLLLGCATALLGTWYLMFQDSVVAEHFWYICLLGSLVSVTDSS